MGKSKTAKIIASFIVVAAVLALTIPAYAKGPKKGSFTPPPAVGIPACPPVVME